MMLGGFQPLPATGPGLLLEAIQSVVRRVWVVERLGRGKKGPAGHLGDAGVGDCGVQQDFGKLLRRKSI
jgi:hypothetical protein